MTVLSDSDLLRRLRSGDEEAAAVVYHRYAGPLSYVVSHHIARRFQARFGPEDIVNSLMGTFFRRARDGHFSLQSERDLWKLLVTIGLNKVRGRIRAGRTWKADIRREVPLNRSNTGEGAYVADMPDAPSHEEQIALEEVLQMLHERLSPSERLIWEHRLAGHTHAAIAEKTGFCTKTVRRVLNDRIPRKAQEWFPECFEEREEPAK